MRDKPDMRNDKLARMLECAELDVPESWIREQVNLPALAQRARAEGKRSVIARIPKRAWVGIVPACAAAAVLVLFMAGMFDFMRGYSGAAGIVSGDVVVKRGGVERILHAGDPVSRDDIIVTGANSSADLNFTGLLRMRILGGSRVAVRAVSLKGVRVFDALVTSGGCVLDVNSLRAGESVSVHTPASVGVVRGTRFGVLVGVDGKARYEVFRGTVRVRRCLPGGDAGTWSADTAQTLERYFREHYLDLKGGHACAIGHDPVTLQSITAKTPESVLASLAVPEPVAGTPVLDGDMERLVRSSDSGGARPGVETGLAARRDLTAERERGDRGGASLIYIPVLDCVIKIGERRLTAIRHEDVLWSVPLDGPVLAVPAYETTSLYVSTGRGMINKIDLITGGTQWKAAVPGGRYGCATLALDAGGLYCAAPAGVLTKFDRSGDILWSVTTDEIISARPVVSGRLVFISTRSGSLFGFDASSGAREVKVSLRGSIVSIAAVKNSVFIATANGRLYCYNHGDDVMVWEHGVEDAPACDMTVSGGSVYLFGRGGHVYRIRTDGNPVWDRDLGISIMKRPAEDAASFYIPASDSLFVVDKTTGDVTWSLILPHITSNNVAVSKGHIFFETGKKRLSSLKK